jgi:hypothetical protein
VTYIVLINALVATSADSVPSSYLVRITIAHIGTAPLIYAGGNMEDLILRLINSILKTGQIPDIFKVGLVTPIFKNLLIWFP